MIRRTAFLAALLVLAACSKNPYTGRRQFIVIPRSTEAQLGREAYQQTLGGVTVSAEPAEVEPVVRVGRRIAEQAEAWARAENQEMSFDWEFNVIQDPNTVNAFCLPGGKIAFYTGIFPAAHDEAGVAVIMGHEVAHAMLRHGSERMSQGVATQVGAVLLAVGLSKQKKETVALAMGAYGVGSQVGLILPFSRKHESEADHLGLILAARAGYDPHAGPEVWRRMEAMSGNRPPEILSTHPDPARRIRNMEGWLPEVMPEYERSEKATVAVLPPPQGGRSAGPAQLSASAMGFAAGESEGEPARTFRFSLPQDAYISRVRVNGTAIEVQGPVSANTPVEVAVPMDVAGAPGTYTVVVEGRQSGRPFTTTLTYVVD